MAVPDREIAPTRIALLELLDERRLVREGYELLDERRMLLAARILRGLQDLERRRSELAACWDLLLRTLRSALGAHGLNDLEAWPPGALALTLSRRVESVLGVEIASATAEVEIGPTAWPAVADSPTIKDCIEAVSPLLIAATPLAALESSLLRLADEYLRTERRTRAIENVLLPELETDLRNVEAALEGLDQEEVVRVHSLRTSGWGQ
jgi:V/A-type H+-transporting ATPase subunit D